MKVISLQKSGLGNQLFQYAAARYYAGRYGAQMEMIVDPPHKAVSHGYPRPFLLSHFNTNAHFRPFKPADRAALNDRPQLRPVVSAMRGLLGIEVCIEPISQRYTFIEDLPIGRGCRVAYLGGYWQTHRIPDAIAGELRPELAFGKPAEGRNRELLDQIAACRTPVSLHVRRGDYTLAAEGNIALPLSYYERAIEHMLERLDDPTFFIFSDDIGFARANLPQTIRRVFVDHNDDTTSHEDLRLMSACRHHIIANSSFSWWGAWLNPDPDKLVFAPKYWQLKPETYYPDLFPPGWHVQPV